MNLRLQLRQHQHRTSIHVPGENPCSAVLASDSGLRTWNKAADEIRSGSISHQTSEWQPWMTATHARILEKSRFTLHSAFVESRHQERRQVRRSAIVVASNAIAREGTSLVARCQTSAAHFAAAKEVGRSPSEQDGKTTTSESRGVVNRARSSMQRHRHHAPAQRSPLHTPSLAGRRNRTSERH